MKVLVDQLASVLPFSRLPRAQLKALLAPVSLREALPGHILIGQHSADRDYIVLLEGELEEAGSWATLQGGYQRHVRQFKADLQVGPAILSAVPRGSSVHALTAVKYVRIDGNKLDELLATAQYSPEEAALQKRLALVGQSSAFRQLPVENVRRAVERMQPRVVRAGEAVVKQGEKADQYFVIENGEAEAWRFDGLNEQNEYMGRLGPGAVFGEEALLLGGFRACTVNMLTDGRLWTLTKEDFDALVTPSLVEEIDAHSALRMVAAGEAEWLDCRYEMEYEEIRIPGAPLFPLETLRANIGRLDPARTYIAYCRSGRRSRCATYLLRERNIKALSLIGGIREWPFALEGRED